MIFKLERHEELPHALYIDDASGCLMTLVDLDVR